MNVLPRLRKALMLCLLAPALLQAPVYAQEKPVMENVFFNVVWGSAFGAALGLSVAVIGSADHSAPDDARSATFQGATVGGLIGLGVGLYLVYGGLSFDPSASSFGAGIQNDSPPVAGQLNGAPGTEQPPRSIAAAEHLLQPSIANAAPPTDVELAPFTLVTAAEQPGRITGFTARVLDLRF